MQNIVRNMYVKFHNDRLRNDRALVLWKSDNNNNNNNNKKTFVALGDPLPGLKKCQQYFTRYFIKYRRKFFHYHSLQEICNKTLKPASPQTRRYTLAS